MMPANILFVKKVLDDIVNFKIVDKETLNKTIIEPIFGASTTGSDENITKKFKSQSLLVKVLQLLLVVVLVMLLIAFLVCFKKKVLPRCC